MSAEIKPIYGLKRVELASRIPLATPMSVYVFPSTYCNFKCVYCAHSFTPDVLSQQYGLEREIMSLETYAKVIEQLGRFPERIKLLSLTGQGEPLLNKQIPQMVSIAKAAGIAERIEIISNGQLLTHRMADALIEAGLDTLRISVQGLSQEKYRDIGGVDIDFDQFMTNIRYFHKHKRSTQLFVKVIDVSLEPDEEPAFYRLFGDCSDRMYVERMLPAYDGVPLTQGMAADYDRYGRKINQRRVCPLAFYMLGIFPNGDVEPCDTIYKPVVLGNVHQQEIQEMWQSDKLRDFWLAQLRGNRFANDKCAKCNAPNDVSHPEDILDGDAERLIANLTGLSPEA